MLVISVCLRQCHVNYVLFLSGFVHRLGNGKMRKQPILSAWLWVLCVPFTWLLDCTHGLPLDNQK